MHAASEVGPGDSVHVADGSYQGFQLTSSGTPGNPIRFLAAGSDARISADNPSTPDGINLEGAASHVVIEGFRVDQRTRTGIRAVLGSHVTIRNNRLGYNGRWGVLTGFVDDLLIEGNEAHHSQLEHGIYVSNSCDRPVVRGNHLHANHANGLHMNADASLGGDGRIEDALVENNVIHGNGAGGGSGINLDGGVGAVIRNNLLYDNHASGISFYRIDGGAPSTGNLVVNNTVVNAANGRWCINIRDGSTGNTLRNNILYNLHAFRGAISVDEDSLEGFHSDYNALMDRFTTNDGNSVMGLAAWQALGHDAHSSLATPAELFLAPGSDFHLLPASPAVDAGTPAGAPGLDLDGAPRPMGGEFDLGAYELQLLECGDGNLDEGEACEVDGDCAAGQSCLGCGCVTPALCASGVTLEKARFRLRADGRFDFAAQALFPGAPPLDPAADGLRFVVSDGSGTKLLDVEAPAGSAWSAKGSAQWSYAAPVGGIHTATLRRSTKQPGLASLALRGVSSPAPALDPADLETTLVLGPGALCASRAWNPPGAPRPSCAAKGSDLACR